MRRNGLLLIGLLLLLCSSCLHAAHAKPYEAMEAPKKQLKRQLSEDGKPHVRRYPEDTSLKNHHFISRQAFINYGGA